MLAEKWDGDAKNFARLILNRASLEGQDDLSVVITEIKKSPTTGEESSEKLSA